MANVHTALRKTSAIVKGMLPRSQKLLSEDSLARDNSHHRFHEACQRISSSPHYDSVRNAKAPYGYLYGRQIIGESNPVNGGIYLGIIPHEGVVVDEKYGALNNLYNELVMRYARDHGKRSHIEDVFFSHITALTREALPLNEKNVRKLAHQKKIGPDRKTALDFYIKQRIGAARHQVLLGAYFLQKLQLKGLIGGLSQIDHRYSALPGEDERLIYTTSAGKILIFDPIAMTHLATPT